jgi:hypothetical protein
MTVIFQTIDFYDSPFRLSIFVTVMVTRWTSIHNLARIGQEKRKVRIEDRARGGAVTCGTGLQTGRSRVRFPMTILPATVSPWVRLSL